MTPFPPLLLGVYHSDILTFNINSILLLGVYHSYIFTFNINSILLLGVYHSDIFTFNINSILLLGVYHSDIFTFNMGGGGMSVTSAWSPLGNFIEGQAHPNVLLILCFSHVITYGSGVFCITFQSILNRFGGKYRA